MVPEHLTMRPPGIYYDGLVQLAAQLAKDTVIAEIGSYCGESSRIFLDSGNVRMIFCIDPWISNYDPTDLIAGKDLAEVERVFDVNMITYNNFVKIKQYSIDAVKMFPDRFFDCVYVDGDHRYEHVKTDVLTWRQKVKTGGLLLGHDFGFPGVKQALYECFGVEPRQVFCDGSWLYQL